jgi:hypothetical protein
MSKWDGFSAFDSDAWDRRYRRGKYKDNPAPRLLAILALCVACILIGVLA